ARGNAMAILNTVGYVFQAGMLLAMTALVKGGLHATGQLWCVALLTGSGALLAWATLGSSSWGLFRRRVQPAEKAVEQVEQEETERTEKSQEAGPRRRQQTPFP